MTTAAIKDGEASPLFTVLEIYELKSWANGYITALAKYVEYKNFVEDDWVEYILPSGETANVRISLDRDEQSPDHYDIGAFVYRTMLDAQDNRTTDTSDCIRLV